MTDHNLDRVSKEILALERLALSRWSNGDPSGFLEITAPDVTYFDPFLERRIDGFEALRRYYESIRGKIGASSFEILNPQVQLRGPTAVLTYNFTCVLRSGKELRWNCTEVYLLLVDSRRIIHTHWSVCQTTAS
ncbi:MAG TPA: nuclear transport factor 2 family protein [Polyangiaceae bacterium]